MTDSLQKYLAEVFGTFTLIFIGTLGVLAARGQLDTSVVVISLAFGFALVAALYAFGEVSGGHFNPIVTLAIVLDRRLDTKDAVPYWVAQFAGAVLASLCVLIAFDQNAVELTATAPGPVGAWEALFLEALASAIFVLVILRVTESGKFGATAFLAIPLTLAAVNFALAPFTGASVNPARSFGPALIGATWDDFWVYVVGPPLGAILGWLVYAVVVKAMPGTPAEEAKAAV
ncbi:MAG TPA: aquaporin [Gaiellaceae bacterium]|nr:aquaporin [Gaiellaceae bacterium]